MVSPAPRSHGCTGRTTPDRRPAAAGRYPTNRSNGRCPVRHAAARSTGGTFGYELSLQPYRRDRSRRRIEHEVVATDSERAKVALCEIDRGGSRVRQPRRHVNRNHASKRDDANHVADTAIGWLYRGYEAAVDGDQAAAGWQPGTHTGHRRKLDWSIECLCRDRRRDRICCRYDAPLDPMSAAIDTASTLEIAGFLSSVACRHQLELARCVHSHAR